MFADFPGFDEAYRQYHATAAAPGLQRRKTLKERLGFYLANLLSMPVVAIVYATVVADGIRLLFPIFRRRLYTLPIPGASLTREYDGWEKLDMSTVVALALFVVVTALWCRIFNELQGYGTLAAQRHRAPVVFYMLSFIAGTIILLDAGVFYYGLAAQTSSGWSTAPSYVVPAATLIYSCGLAALGFWHSDYQTSSRL